MRFAALRAPWYRGYLAGGSLMMAADHVEHAITYFVMWRLFESPLLAGFAVVSHWLPQLLFAIPSGALADRFDCRRLVQLGAACFMVASAGWAILIGTNSLQPWHCVVLLTLHGLAGTLWGPAEQLMLYDIVGPRDLPSAVRLQATGLNLGMLVGPALGAGLLFSVGPTWGMWINVALYVPFVLYLAAVPFDGHTRNAERGARAGWRELLGVFRELPRIRPILVVVILQTLVGLCIGVSFVPLLPEFGALLGLDDSALGYGLLIVAMAIGAIVGGVTLEAVGRIPVGPRIAIVATIGFAAALAVFAVSRQPALSIAALLTAGLANLVSTSTSQTVVQLEAPPARRGRFLGAYAMAASGSRVGSGLIVGALGAAIGVTAAVSIAAVALLVAACALLAVVLLTSRKRLPVS